MILISKYFHRLNNHINNKLVFNNNNLIKLYCWKEIIDPLSYKIYKIIMKMSKEQLRENYNFLCQWKNNYYL